MGNILDREACEIVVTNGSPLFEQDLATLLKKHFQDVLTQLEEQANAEDKDPEAENAWVVVDGQPVLPRLAVAVVAVSAARFA